MHILKGANLSKFEILRDPSFKELESIFLNK